MKARARKSGGAYRNYKQKMTCHAKPGKDRRAARGQAKQHTAEYKGYTATYDNNRVNIYNSSGKQVEQFNHHTSKPTAEQLKDYIDFYFKLVGLETTK